jgi:hypothetical protein
MRSNEIDKAESIRFFIKESKVFSDRDYDRLAEQIEGHRYFLGKKLGYTVNWDEATFSWQSNIYEPVVQLLDSWTAAMSFPHRRKADLVFEIIDHLYYLSLERGKEVLPEIAALHYSANYGKGIGRWLARIQSPSNAA